MLVPLIAILLSASTPVDAAKAQVAQNSDYAIVVSESTNKDADWRKVVDALKARHGGTVITYKSSVADALAKLKQQFPKYTCFVAKSKEATKQLVAQVHQLTRALDGDPYTDTRWGILTGYDAAGALKIAQHDEPLTIRKVASGTEIAMDMVVEGVWYCELQKHRMVQKKPDAGAEELSGPADTTKALVDTLNEYKADLFVTSGHATERDWQIGFRYRNGSFRSQAGQLYGQDTSGAKHPISSPNPKVYLPIGNCLMGNINGKDAMALAWMQSAGVHQMIGYTVPTWFGYGGWGCLDYFVEQPGRYTFTGAFLANHHALIYCIENELGNQRGMNFDRDVVAFYGDPAWVARMADKPKAYEQTLTENKGVFTLTIKGNRGDKSFTPVNTNGAQRGWRPIVAFLPYRVKDVELVEASGLMPVITDDFILIPNPREYDPAKSYVVKFTAKAIKP
jgi:hypothetical protein